MENISCCGTNCEECECFGTLCKGCNQCKGMVFHAPEGKACPIYDCTVNNRKLSNCGQCKEVPCSVWKSTRDPKFTDEEFDANIESRLKTLKSN